MTETRQIEQMWKDYKDTALVYTDGSFQYTVADIKDDFYSGVTACLALIAEAMGGGSQATLDTITELQAELKEYWND